MKFCRSFNGTIKNIWYQYYLFHDVIAVVKSIILIIL
jgi:hypothetical protein